jgi:predicted ATPase
MKIETLEIHNYKVLQNVKIDNLGSMAVFLGENGVGKTTLFDVFGFIKSCLTENVRSALQARGGYAEVHSRDAHGDISFIVRYKDSSGKPQFIYELHIGLNEKGEPVIACEALYTEDPGKKIFVFQRENDRLNSLYWPEGNLGNVTGDYPPAIGSIELANSDTLALNIFGQMAQYQYAVEFRKFLEDWFVSDFQIDKMKLTQDVSYNESLTRKGDNIANVAQFLFALRV